MTTPQPPQHPDRPTFLAPGQAADTTPVAGPPVMTPVPANAPIRSRRRRRPKIIAAAAAGTLLVGAVGLGAATTSGTVSATGFGTGQTQTWTWGPSTGSGNGGTGSGSGGWSDPSTGSGNGTWSDPSTGSGNGGSGSGSASGTSTVDSQAATSAESTGVALIDTVLTNGDAAGTGMVLTADGEVLTNYHVVEGSTLIKVTIASTGKTYSASVVGADKSADVALLQLKDASNLSTVKIDDDTLKTGDAVTAVGNAGGTGELSAADGKITDLSTSITTASEYGVSGEKLTKLIETSSDVVAGDSGGPLIDSEGEVVGMDTAASTGSVINGYAIAIDNALLIVSEIRADQESASVRIGPAAYLGVELSTTQTSERRGATIAGVVSGGAADQVGLAAGDNITKIGSTDIGSATSLQTAIAKLQPGDKTKITWTTSSGTSKSATVTLKASPIN